MKPRAVHSKTSTYYVNITWNQHYNSYRLNTNLKLYFHICLLLKNFELKLFPFKYDSDGTVDILSHSTQNAQLYNFHSNSLFCNTRTERKITLNIDWKSQTFKKLHVLFSWSFQKQSLSTIWSLMAKAIYCQIFHVIFLQLKVLFLSKSKIS